MCSTVLCPLVCLWDKSPSLLRAVSSSASPLALPTATARGVGRPCASERSAPGYL